MRNWMPSMPRAPPPGGHPHRMPARRLTPAMPTRMGKKSPAHPNSIPPTAITQTSRQAPNRLCSIRVSTLNFMAALPLGEERRLQDGLSKRRANTSSGWKPHPQANSGIRPRLISVRGHSQRTAGAARTCPLQPRSTAETIRSPAAGSPVSYRAPCCAHPSMRAFP